MTAHVIGAALLLLAALVVARTMAFTISTRRENLRRAMWRRARALHEAGCDPVEAALRAREETIRASRLGVRGWAIAFAVSLMMAAIWIFLPLVVPLARRRDEARARRRSARSPPP